MVFWCPILHLWCHMKGCGKWNTVGVLHLSHCYVWCTDSHTLPAPRDHRRHQLIHHSWLRDDWLLGFDEAAILVLRNEQSIMFRRRRAFWLQFLSPQLRIADWSLATTVHCNNSSCGWVGGWVGNLGVLVSWVFFTGGGTIHLLKSEIAIIKMKHVNQCASKQSTHCMHTFLISYHSVPAPAKQTLRGLLGSNMALRMQSTICEHSSQE